MKCRGSLNPSCVLYEIDGSLPIKYVLELIEEFNHSASSGIYEIFSLHSYQKASYTSIPAKLCCP